MEQKYEDERDLENERLKNQSLNSLGDSAKKLYANRQDKKNTTKDNPQDNLKNKPKEPAKNNSEGPKLKDGNNTKEKNIPKDFQKNAEHLTNIAKDIASGTTAGATAGASIAAEGAKEITDKAKELISPSSKIDESTNIYINQDDTNNGSASKTALVPIIAFIGIPIFIVFLIVMLLSSIVTTMLAPVMALYNGVNNAWSRVAGFSEEIGKNRITYNETNSILKDKFNQAFEDAYLKTCYRELFQIIKEKGYDMQFTMDSYNETTYPYNLEDGSCNINYSEILGIISFNNEFSYENFNYNEFEKLLKNQEFLRCLYDLKVTETEGIKLVNSPENATVHINSRKSITITTDDASTTYTPSNTGPYCIKVIYGEVEVGKYVLKKIYEYMGVDPYAANKKMPNFTNHQLLSTYDMIARTYHNANWGSDERTPLLNFQKLTGIINESIENIFTKDLHNAPILQDTYVYMDTTEYKQYDQRWANQKYGSGTMKSLGCCVTAMSIVCNYFNNSMDILPDTLLNHINANYNGLLYRTQVATDFGIYTYNSTSVINISTMVGELKNERLIIAHIAPFQKGTGKYGHFVVLNGYENKNGDAFFYVTEPANRLEKTVSIAEAAMIFDSYVSYGKE